MAELNGGAVVLGESEVSFANEIYVDESVDIPLETAAPEVTEATTIEIITSTIKARPILTTAAVTIGGAALATSAYVAYFYTGGLISLAAPAARSIAVGWVMSQVTEGGKHLKFLYPLWGESRSSCEKRLKYVQEKIQEDKLVFRCFYLELPPIPDPKKDASVTPETEKPAVVRTFIKPPPESVSDLFTPVQMDVLDLQDVVTAHVSMLRRTSNIGMYWYLVDETARSLSALLTKLEGQKEA
ncbi:hypothetical protein BCR33DRAFT_211466 [Rhizoclosmatium globosum]|uniref:Uncharacterized protein n=1 Tax=Rhizoclosmatium globosum TaxID=329046 RepID=A0A1Y2CDH9_9FUNG|nr:hypothetical protein BCR33DRAFT_211466 [Rhizoclosmatium globosum]|eukprot:ORY44874.1 hypothetical protein BCR33DRAFT_211466 [Rhizoclosmatium globosum]